jgi:serine/threonine protein kinase
VERTGKPGTIASSDSMLWQHQGKPVALDIVRGVMELHAKRIIHRDLKSKNVLLKRTPEGVLMAKVADVGVAGHLSATDGYLTGNGAFGTLAWASPELLMGNRITIKADIYSLGIVLWEIATSKVPFRGFVEMPKPSERCPEGLIRLIESCTRQDPKSRPSAAQVYAKLLKIPPHSNA